MTEYFECFGIYAKERNKLNMLHFFELHKHFLIEFEFSLIV